MGSLKHKSVSSIPKEGTLNILSRIIKAKSFRAAILIFDIVVWSWNVYVYNSIIWPSYEAFKYNNVGVVSDIVLPEPTDLKIGFEYCKLPEDNIDPVSQFVAGTPIPFEPVPISTQTVNELPTATFQIEATPSSIPHQNDYSNLKVIKVGSYGKNNFHFVLVGVGYNGENKEKMQTIIDSFSGNFAGINADFAYVETSIDLDFKHIQQMVNFENEADQKILFDAIKEIYPVDGLVVAINTPTFLGTSHWNAAMLTSNDPNTVVIATHEMGHQLGLDDGYQAFYEEDGLPSTELFYVDEMPTRLVSALKKMDKIPPLYKVGVCNGKSVYSFYESRNNRMRDYDPSETKSWGDTAFTPLQIVLMNDYIAWYKEVYK